MTTTSLSAPAKQLKRRSSGDQAALYIRKLIFDGELRPGTRVPQDEVARAMGISRIPIREALISLEHEGWVTIEMHRGAFVNQLDERAVRDHYDLYGLTYGFAVERAIERSDDAFSPALTAVQKAFMKAEDPGTIWRLAIDFHEVVLAAAQSPRIRIALRAMPGMIPGNFFEQVPHSIEVERRGLTAIAKAVRKGDGPAAAEGYATMMRNQADNVVVVLAANGLFDSPEA